MARPVMITRGLVHDALTVIKRRLRRIIGEYSLSILIIQASVWFWI
jgi:hypothetical protein